MILSLKKDYLTKQIQHRYAILERPKNGESNIVADSFVPLYDIRILNNRSIGDNLPKTTKFISRYFAEKFGTQKLSIDDMVKELGFKMKDIEKMLIELKKRNRKLCMVGYGGTGVNFAYWTFELCEALGKSNIFEKVIIYEPEEADYSNLLRFPKNCATINNVENALKLNLFYQEFLITKEAELIPEYLNDESAKELDESGYIFYGAPNIETREMLEKYNFIAGTHGGDSCSLYSKPKQQSSLQTETYGTIRLNSFFMNQLYMTIAFLDFLSDENIEFPEDTQLMKYNFIESENIAKYNFFKDQELPRYTEQEQLAGEEDV